MPKTADYSKGFIYKFVCNDITIPNTYTGSSTDWIKRKNCHKSACNNDRCPKYNLYVYQFMRANGGWNNFTMLKICDFPCQNKFELELEERKYMELLKSDLNKQKPGRNKEEIKEYIEKYRKDNKEKLNEKCKEYYDNNKEKIQERVKQYFEDNKEKIQEQRKEVDCCPTCGTNYQHMSKSRHLKTKKHIDAIQPI